MRFVIERKGGKILVVDADVAEERGDKVYFYRIERNSSQDLTQQFCPIGRVLVASINDYKCFYVEN